MKTSDQTLKTTKAKPHPFWKWFWLTFLLVSLIYAWYSFYVPSNQIQWNDNVTSIQNLNNDFGQKTVLFFTAEWCSPCRIMKREVFADKEVEQIVNSQYKAIMVDIDHSNTKDIVHHYKVNTTPTTIIINSKGEVLDYAKGKLKKKKFLEMLNHLENQ